MSLFEHPPAGLALTVGQHRVLRDIIQQEDLRVIEIEFSADELNMDLWSAAAESGCVIRSLTPSKNSLEQIFLKAVREVHRANS